MRTDSIFYQLFQTFPSIFFELIGQSSAEVQARQLIQQTQHLEDEAVRRRVLELIETILVYKFPQLSRQEIEAMFALSDLKQTRVYQEAKEEGREEAKLEIAPRLIQLGLTVEQVAAVLELDVERVRQTAEEQSETQSDS